MTIKELKFALEQEGGVVCLGFKCGQYVLDVEKTVFDNFFRAVCVVGENGVEQIKNASYDSRYLLADDGFAPLIEDYMNGELRKLVGKFKDLPAL